MFCSGISGEIGNYKKIELSTSAEYAILFFFLAFLFSGEKNLKKISCV